MAADGPAIKRAVPHAKLDVYHGFTPVYDAMAELYPGLNEIRRDLLRLLDETEKREGGVRFHGMVGHKRLAEGFAAAGVWMYPTETPETSCITAMKALAMGCLPVTSGYAVLGETLGGARFRSGACPETHRQQPVASVGVSTPRHLGDEEWRQSRADGQTARVRAVGAPAVFVEGGRARLDGSVPPRRPGEIRAAATRTRGSDVNRPSILFFTYYRVTPVGKDDVEASSLLMRVDLRLGVDEFDVHLVNLWSAAGAGGGVRVRP